VVVADLAVKVALRLRHLVEVEVEVDRILCGISLLHCLAEQKPLLLAVEELVVRL
jgi:hypothetical protein